MRASATCDQQAEAQRILFPNYGMHVGGALGNILRPELLLVAGGAVVGHVSGRLQTQRVPTPTETDIASAQGAPQNSVQINENPGSDRNAPIVRGQEADGQTIHE